MYINLRISSEVSEKMVILKSLPICSVIFDKKGCLIDINSLVLKLLNVRSVDDLKGKEKKIIIRVHE